ncbi:MAG TPA: SCO family protein [Burkholderiaceae bacterium]|nr:SCO family protein [Burkholderiaceae bacterium]
MIRSLTSRLSPIALALVAGLCLALPAFADTAAQQEDAARPTAVHSVRGFLPDLRFKLDGAEGKTYTEKDFRGKTVMLFFGYASCPDICPTTMAQLSQVMQELGPDADRARIVFISVDPHRDTADILQAYVNIFDSNAIGLTGSEKQIADVARRYRVAYQIEKPKSDDPDAYEVAHSRGIYIFDEKGRARILASDGESVDALLKAVRDVMDS